MNQGALLPAVYCTTINFKWTIEHEYLLLVVYIEKNSFYWNQHVINQIVLNLSNK